MTTVNGEKQKYFLIINPRYQQIQSPSTSLWILGISIATLLSMFLWSWWWWLCECDVRLFCRSSYLLGVRLSCWRSGAAMWNLRPHNFWVRMSTQNKDIGTSFVNRSSYTRISVATLDVILGYAHFMCYFWQIFPFKRGLFVFILIQHLKLNISTQDAILCFGEWKCLKFWLLWIVHGNSNKGNNNKVMPTNIIDYIQWLCNHWYGKWMLLFTSFQCNIIHFEWKNSHFITASEQTYNPVLFNLHHIFAIFIFFSATFSFISNVQPKISSLNYMLPLTPSNLFSFCWFAYMC